MLSGSMQNFQQVSLLDDKDSQSMQKTTGSSASSSTVIASVAVPVHELKMRNSKGEMRKGFHDPISIISSFLTGDPEKNAAKPNDFNALASYVRTGRHDNLSLLFVPPLEKEKQVRLKKLLGHVVRGELKEVKEMLQVPSNRSLLRPRLNISCFIF